MFKGNEFIVKTIVTTELLTEIAHHYNVEIFDVLTGFKFIADIIKQNEGHKKFIAGGEESYGYLISDFVRDKDAVISCCFIAEAAAWAANQGKSFYDILIDIYIKYGFYKEQLISITKKGIKGTEEIAQMMADYRNAPPQSINNSKVVKLIDYQSSIEHDFINNTSKTILLPKSNVLQFILEDKTKITVRPSGTEPKIKFYFSVKEKLDNKDNYQKVNAKIGDKLKLIVKSLNLQ